MSQNRSVSNFAVWGDTLWQGQFNKERGKSLSNGRSIHNPNSEIGIDTILLEVETA
jgi:hypothetical protein